MYVAHENFVAELSKAKTRRKRKNILYRLHVELANGKTGNDLFRHLLTQLETNTSHLDTISYANLQASTIRKNQLLVSTAICVEMIDAALKPERLQRFKIIESFWPLVRKLLRELPRHRGTRESLYQRIRLAHRASKVMLEAWKDPMDGQSPSSMYYSAPEEEFAQHLPFPLNEKMPINCQLTALTKNVETILNEPTQPTSLKEWILRVFAPSWLKLF